jgi:hypothetical protein
MVSGEEFNGGLPQWLASIWQKSATLLRGPKLKKQSNFQTISIVGA